MRTLKLFLDNSLELATAAARVASVLFMLGAVAMTVGTIWSTGPDTEKWAATAALLLGVGLAVGWVGWWAFGNETWRKRGTDG